MATSTEFFIASQTITSGTTITFTSIPSTYTDLRLVISGTVTSSSANLFVQPNSNASAVYSFQRLVGLGSTSNTTGTSLGATYWNLIAYSGVVPTYPQLYTMDIFSYNNALFKTAIWGSHEENRNATLSNNAVARVAGTWASTAAITSLNIYTDVTASSITASLWGIL